MIEKIVLLKDGHSSKIYIATLKIDSSSKEGLLYNVFTVELDKKEIYFQRQSIGAVVKISNSTLHIVPNWLEFIPEQYINPVIVSAYKQLLQDIELFEHKRYSLAEIKIQ